MIKQTSYWQDHTQPLFSSTTIHKISQPKVDVVVVGGGYTGLNASLHLAKAGQKVVLIEHHQLGSGASSKNAGMLLPGFKVCVSELAKKQGLLFAKDMWQWSLDAISYVKNLVDQHQIQCDWQNCGSLELAHAPNHLMRLQKVSDFLHNKLSYDQCTMVAKHELQDEINTPKFHGALVDSSSCSLHPGKYVHALARTVIDQGVSCVENTKVLNIKKLFHPEHSFQVSTSNGELWCRKVLIATNGYSSWKFPEIRTKIIPMGSYMIATEPLTEDLQKQIFPRMRMFFDTKKLLHYFRLSPDRRLLFGGRDALSNNLNLQVSARKLKNAVNDLFPELKHTKVTHSWSGKLAVTLNLCPHLIEKKGIYYAYGYCGHGVSMASYLGWEASQCILNNKISPIHQQISKHSLVPPFIDQLLLPTLGQYYRIKDQFFP